MEIKQITIEKDESVDFPSEILYLFDSALKKSQKKKYENKTIFTLGDFHIPTGTLSISPVIYPYNYFIMDYQLNPGTYPLYLNYEKHMKHMGYHHLYLLRLKSCSQVCKWKAIYYRPGKFPPINGTDPNLIGEKRTAEVNLFDSPILIMDFQSLLWIKQKCKNKEFNGQIEKIKLITENKEIKNKFIDIDGKHNFTEFNSILGPATYFSYIGFNNLNEPVCIIFDFHIYFYREPKFEIEFQEFHGFGF